MMDKFFIPADFGQKETSISKLLYVPLQNVNGLSYLEKNPYQVFSVQF